MRARFILGAILALGLLFSGCYDEKNVEPSGDYSPIRFKFPQGTAQWDTYFEQVYNDYGLCIIYKDFTQEDLNKTWQVSVSGKWKGHPVSDERMPIYLDLLQNYMIPFMKSKEIVSACGPLYLYLADDLSATSVYVGLGSHLGGQDFWAMGLADTLPLPMPVNSKMDIVNTIYVELVERAILKKKIPVPDGFTNGIDYVTTVNKSDKNDPNYYPKRGFVGVLNKKTGYGSFLGMFSWVTPESGSWYGNVEQILTVKGGDFMMFTYAAMCYTEKEFREKFPLGEYPLVNARYDMVVSQFRKYGFDLPGYAQKVKELPPRW